MRSFRTHEISQEFYRKVEAIEWLSHLRDQAIREQFGNGIGVKSTDVGPAHRLQRGMLLTEPKTDVGLKSAVRRLLPRYAS